MLNPQSENGETRHETQLERFDRNLEEMTGELRVIVTGVQVLFAFLLIVPFDTGFAQVGNFERTVYFITLILTALAAVCTIAPSAEHRFLFRHDDKQYLVFSSNWVVIRGPGVLGAGNVRLPAASHNQAVWWDGGRGDSGAKCDSVRGVVVCTADNTVA